jgi:hypothetical protein
MVREAGVYHRENDIAHGVGGGAAWLRIVNFIARTLV